MGPVSILITLIGVSAAWMTARLPSIFDDLDKIVEKEADRDE